MESTSDTHANGQQLGASHQLADADGLSTTPMEKKSAIVQSLADIAFGSVCVPSPLQAMGLLRLTLPPLGRRHGGKVHRVSI